MSIFASLPVLGEYIVPTKFLLSFTPPLFSPYIAITHGVTTAYFPMFLRIFEQARLEPQLGYDNLNPRAQIQRLAGKSEYFDRLHYAHLNHLESLPVFIGAMIAGTYAGIDKERQSKLATLWIILRNAFTFLYLVQTKRTSGLRSLLFLWSLAISCNIFREAAKKIKEQDS
mmetsp:Transcript_2732/g.3510  ORF Transcript_2732/g.3510 Transcript_2732/m.3510 type:complete len:171 (-) Transcript_2732:160-672(-)